MFLISLLLYFLILPGEIQQSLYLTVIFYLATYISLILPFQNPFSTVLHSKSSFSNFFYFSFSHNINSYTHSLLALWWERNATKIYIFFLSSFFFFFRLLFEEFIQRIIKNFVYIYFALCRREHAFKRATTIYNVSLIKHGRKNKAQE